MKNIRIFAITLLDDENGINEDAFNMLAPELFNAGCQDVLDAVECQDGRYYLGEDDAQDLLAVGTIPVENYAPTETPLGELIEGD